MFSSFFMLLYLHLFGVQDSSTPFHIHFHFKVKLIRQMLSCLIVCHINSSRVEFLINKIFFPFFSFDLHFSTLVKL